MAFSADAADLDHDAACSKTAGPSGRADSVEGIWRIGFADALAPFTHKRDGLRPGRMLGHAGEKSVSAFEPMNKARALEHLQNAIDGDRREAFSVLCEALDQIVGADRLVASRNVAEHLLAKRRPLDPKLQASRSGASECVADTNAVVVATRRKGDGFLSDHASHVMLLRFFGNPFPCPSVA